MNSGKKKKVLFVETGMGFGGSAVSLLEILKNLNGYEPVLLLYAKKDSYFLRFFDNYNPIFLNQKFTYLHVNKMNEFIERRAVNARVALILRKLFVLGSYINDCLTEFRIKKIIKKRNIDIVHSNNTIDDVVIRSAMSMNVPVVNYLRGHVDSGSGRKCLNYIEYCLAPTKKIAEFAKNKLGVEQNKILVVPDTVTAEDYSAPQKSKDIRERYGIGIDTVVVSMFARIISMKGHIYLIKAINLLIQQGYNIKCFLVGDSSDYDPSYIIKVREEIKKAGFEDRYVFTGYQGSTAPYYGASDIVVHPSIEDEAFGRIIIEAWASGKPIVASDIGASAELISHEVDGLIVPKESDEKIASAIKLLIEDKWMYNNLVTAGKKRSEQFSSRAMVGNLENIYGAVIDNRKKQSIGD